MKNTKAFTLVELIVVVTILAILSTIGFVSYSGYLAGVRDTNRIAQLKAIGDALHLYSTNKSLPTPDDKIDIKTSTKIISYQGYVGKDVIETVGYTAEGLDPKDNTYFSYYLTKNKKYFQLMAFLEEEQGLVLNLNKNISNAEIDYSIRYPRVEGSKLGILTGTGTDLNKPLQELINSGSLNIETTSNEYTANISNDSTLSGIGRKVLIGVIKNVVGNNHNSCKKILESTNGLYGVDGVYKVSPNGDESLSVYCDMTTDGGGWTLVTQNKGTATNFDKDVFVKDVDSTNIFNLNIDNSMSSLNAENFSILVNTNDAMLKSLTYSVTPIIDNNTGNWNYDILDCSGLGHTSRTVGCSNHGGNDNYSTHDRFNLAIYSGGNTSIVPYYTELCWSGNGSCDFEFYLR